MSARAAPGVSVVPPLVDVTIDESGSARVSVDNSPYNEARQVGREEVEHVVHDGRREARSGSGAVTESDHSEFTDVVLPESADGAQGASAESGSGLSGKGLLPQKKTMPP